MTTTDTMPTHDAQGDTMTQGHARVTLEDIEAEIVGEHYHLFLGTTLTIACLILRNGFTVTGESACVDPAAFDEAIGRSIARRNAREKIWGLLGFRLCDAIQQGWTDGE